MSNTEQVYAAVVALAKTGAPVETGALVQHTGLPLVAVEAALRVLLAQGRIVVDAPLASSGKDDTGEFISFDRIRPR